MKKKISIFIIVMLLILLCAIAFFIKNKTDNNIKQKAYGLFGNDYCSNEKSEESGITGMAMTPYKCKLCNKKYEHPNTTTPIICFTCATTTNRCQYCGKLEN